MTIEAEALRQAMRLWTSGVTIVTAQADGQRHGMTVSAFASVSLDPPLVLVSLANTARTGGLVRRSGFFGVTVLKEDQQEVSEIFAGRVPDSADRFAGVRTETLQSGVPFIQGGLATLDCQLVAAHPAGTSTVFIGEVIAAKSEAGGSPLVYFNRDYQDLCP